MTPIWISVDWDLFWKIDDEWDWAFMESPFGREPVWTTRAAGFEAAQKDIRKEMAKVAGLRWQEFWTLLSEAGLKFQETALGLADSHKYALEFFLNCPVRPASKRILHFDAHHDLGYRRLPAINLLDPQDIDSGNWLLHLMARRKQAELRIFYPEWKGYRELDNPDTKPAMLAPVRGRVVPDILGPQTLAVAVPPQPVVEGVFIARSGSWTPPWADHFFAAFVGELERLRKGPPATRYDLLHEELDVLLPRYIDWAVVTRHAERLRALDSNLK